MPRWSDSGGRSMSDHLTQRDLLLYVDGELPGRRAQAVREHLVSCWSCRREMELLEQDIRAIVDAQNRSFLPTLPPPARPWQSFDELSATLPTKGSRYAEWFRWARQVLADSSQRPLRWGMALSALFLAIAVHLWLTSSPLSAEGVLNRVGQADLRRTKTDARAVIRQRVRIERTDRRNSGKRSTQIDSWKAGRRALWRGDNDNLQRRYRARGLDAALPLSSAAWERWLHETARPFEVSSGS